MPRPISPEELYCSNDGGTVVVIDVRKEPAFLASGETIPGAVRWQPSDVASWWPAFAGRRVAVFCVHGHEVSQAVCGFLEREGVDAFFLADGFARWKAAGFPVETFGERP
jgi:thiosulfate sulfurtransferase